MINKKEFLNCFNGCDESIIYKLYDKILLAEKTNKVVYSRFFIYKGIYNKLKSMEKSIDAKIYCNGIFDECERVMISISSYEIPSYYPMVLLKIVNKSKFKNLSHKDYLGSIMAQGIKRELLGDLIVQDNSAYVPVVEEIVDFLILNLNSIGKCPCEVIELQDNVLNIPKINFEEKIVIVTSLRLDNIISSICNISRSKALDLIQCGKVLINYAEETKKDKIIIKEDIVTIRTYGKFKVGEVIGKTNSDRFKISIKKYN
ncbi:RNA-binding protein [Clostridium senegalense]|uniref:YlmH family RNA-binding protein n=1 Tax=Clostridium senegalense TaxID=1465809 RepID=UPI0002884AA6|nr:YlmH/Sll1252 family protein [Clostridium senegalense]